MIRNAHIVFEGLLCSGKTSLVENLKIEIKRQGLEWNVYEEPVELWRNFHGYNMLDMMYKAPHENAMNFQCMAFSTKMNQIRLDKNVNLVERSILSQRNVFIPLLTERNALTDLDRKILYNLIEHMTSLPAGKPDLIIHLKVRPEVSLERIKNRNRPEEQGVQLDYLKRMDDLHEDWYKNSKIPVWYRDAEKPICTSQLITDINYFVLQDERSGNQK